jgi:hypothetical protein
MYLGHNVQLSHFLTYKNTAITITAKLNSKVKKRIPFYEEKSFVGWAFGRT